MRKSSVTGFLIIRTLNEWPTFRHNETAPYVIVPRQNSIWHFSQLLIIIIIIIAVIANYYGASKASRTPLEKILRKNLKKLQYIPVTPRREQKQLKILSVWI